MTLDPVSPARRAARTAMLALDVGGTSIAAGVITADGRLAGDLRHVASPEGEDATTIVGSLVSLLLDLRASAERADLRVVSAGVAMPGPFDYERGVSWMRHKLPALRGLDLTEPMEGALGLPVRFCNDAVAFAVGAWWRELRAEPRLVGITLGTGLGSAFLSHGRPVENPVGAPAGGEIWDLPFRDGILEEAVSGRALERAQSAEPGGPPVEAIQIAARARRGDPVAVAAFTAIGIALGEGLALAASGFRPTVFAVGGRIAKSFDLFGSQAEAAYADAAGAVVPFRAALGADIPLVGVARLI